MSKFKTFIEIEVEVEYDYQPYEPQSKDCPETYAEVEPIFVSVCGVTLEGDKHVHVFNDLDKSTMESIKQQCFENENPDNE